MGLFKHDSTQEAYQHWIGLWDGNYQESHPDDNEVFHRFILEYYRNGEAVSKEEFVKVTKKHIPTTLIHNRGLVQRCYNRLETITRFLKDVKEKNHWL